MPTGAPAMNNDDFRAASIRLDALVREFETLPYPAIRDQIFELLAAVDTIHRIGLHRLATGLEASGQAANLEHIAATDIAVQTLLTLYDLLPEPDDQSPGSEAAQPARAPAAEPPNFIPLSRIKRAPTVRPRLVHTVARLAEVPPGTIREVEMEGTRILLANVAGAIYAVPNSCPGSMAPLSLGSFSPPVITCPWHNDAFDIRTGQRVDNTPGPPLTLLPIEIDGDVIKLRPAGPLSGLPQPPESRP